ncbi:deoxyguanosine kinase, putative [Babesia ovis]|uniref:Deoxyguanosine kinase, putative n=1 Tax=Babesia ovis TaxID=5869 RepID=A0A9W5TA53_BABOV|nr:deoxyguanosine kinase, putative [Babesia ovis]
MGLYQRQELLQALHERFEPLVHDVNLRECVVRVNDTNEVIRTSELYNFFDLTDVDINSPNELKKILDRDFLSGIKLLRSINTRDIRLYELYPLFRRILILTEGFLLQVRNSDRFKERLNEDDMSLIPEISLFTVLDDIYATICGSNIERDVLLSGLSTFSGVTGNRLGTVLQSASTFASLLLPIIRHSLDNSTSNTLELELSTFTFAALQRLSAMFLLLLVIDQLLSSENDVYSIEEADSTSADLSPVGLTDSMLRLACLCKETLQEPLMTRVSAPYLCVSWQEDVVVPILDLLTSTFYHVNKLDVSNEALIDLVIETTKMFIYKVNNDCDPSPVTIDRILLYGRLLISMFSKGTEEVNVILWSHFNARLSHVLKVQQNVAANSSGANSTPNKLSINDTSISGSTNDVSPSPRPVSISVMALVGEGELKHQLKTFATTLDYYIHHASDLFEVLFTGYQRDTDTEMVECISQLFVHFSGLVQLVDALGYITQRFPNSEISELLNHVLTTLWSIIISLGSKMSFDVSKACFYYLGSEYHSSNMAAQICCFKSLKWDLESLQQCYYADDGEYDLRVHMLASLLRNASGLCCVCVSYGPNDDRRVNVNHLSIPFNLIARWFIMEIQLFDFEGSGLVDEFIGWCHSLRSEEYMLAHYLCHLIARLSKEDDSIADGARYILDILLGICMNSEAGNNGPPIVLKGLNPGRTNAFRCIGVLLHNGLFTEWFMRNIMIPQTCAFVFHVRQHISMLGLADSLEQLSLGCYFVTQGLECECISAPIVGCSQNLLCFIELITTIPIDYYKQDSDDHLSQMIGHMLNVLCSLTTHTAQLLYTNKETWDVETLFRMFLLTVRLASALVHTGHFGRKDVEVVSLLKLFSVLCMSSVRLTQDVDIYLSMVQDAIRIFHAIFEHVPVKEQLLKLHRGFMTVLFSKMESHPGFLLRHDIYKNVPSAMFEQLCSNFNNVLQKARSLSHYYGTLYNFRIWMALRRHGIESESIQDEYMDSSLCVADDLAEVRIALNIAFLVFCRLNDVRNMSCISDLVEKGSAIGMYNRT